MSLIIIKNTRDIDERKVIQKNNIVFIKNYQVKKGGTQIYSDRKTTELMAKICYEKNKSRRTKVSTNIEVL